MDKGLQIGDLTISSRLLIGSSGYPNFGVMLKAITASGAEIVTVSVRRVRFDSEGKGNLFQLLRQQKLHILPNMQFCNSAFSKFYNFAIVHFCSFAFSPKL